jgi:hypothetical protein
MSIVRLEKKMIQLEPIISRNAFSYVCFNFPGVYNEFHSKGKFGKKEKIFIKHLIELESWVKDSAVAINAIKGCIENVNFLKDITENFGKGYIRKIRKNYKYHLTKFCKEIIRSFENPRDKKTINFSKEQIYNWIRNDQIGLGDRYNMSKKFLDKFEFAAYSNHVDKIWKKLSENKIRKYKKASNSSMIGFGNGRNDEWRILGMVKGRKKYLLLLFNQREHLAANGPYYKLTQGREDIAAYAR